MHSMGMSSINSSAKIYTKTCRQDSFKLEWSGAGRIEPQCLTGIPALYFNIRDSLGESETGNNLTICQVLETLMYLKH